MYYQAINFPFDLYSTSTALPSMTQTDLGNNPICLPPKNEQEAIARYLDYVVGRVDEVIGQKGELIERLQAKRKALINEVITRGLDPTVPTRPSGIDWLGEIPAHWGISKIGHNSSIVRGGSPRPAGDSRYFNGNYMPWITVKEVTNAEGKFITGTETYLTYEGSLCSRIIEPETLLLSNSGATLGVPKISMIQGCINDGSVAFTSFSNKLTRDFLMSFFETHTDIYREEMKGNGQPNLNTDIIKNTLIPLPPVPEQNQIVAYIEQYKFKIDKLVNTIEEQIAKLKEYKISVISEAVTGKIDVREWQQPTNK